MITVGWIIVIGFLVFTLLLMYFTHIVERYEAPSSFQEAFRRNAINAVWVICIVIAVSLQREGLDIQKWDPMLVIGVAIVLVIGMTIDCLVIYRRKGRGSE